MDTVNEQLCVKNSLNSIMHFVESLYNFWITFLIHLFLISGCKYFFFPQLFFLSPPLPNKSVPSKQEIELINITSLTQSLPVHDNSNTTRYVPIRLYSNWESEVLECSYLPSKASCHNHHPPG